MLSILAVIGCVAVFMTPGLCCRPKEYETSSGQCCLMCHEGSVVKRDCTAWSGTICAPCVSGTFMNQPNGLKKCFPCTSCEKGHGLIVVQECTATMDTVCGALPGYFCKDLTHDTGCRVAQKHARCEPGHRIKTPGTSTTDTVCEPCYHGYFSPDGVNCSAWTTCSETEVKVKDGDTISDVVCGTASRAHYCYISFILLSLTLFGLYVRAQLTSKKETGKLTSSSLVCWRGFWNQQKTSSSESGRYAQLAHAAADSRPHPALQQPVNAPAR